jgi:hypothetical protein
MFRPKLAHCMVEILPSLPFTKTTIDVTANQTIALCSLLHPHKRIIIFVMSISDAEFLSRSLGCAKYYTVLEKNTARYINAKADNYTS